MPSQSFTHRATAAADPKVVWEALNRPETWEGIVGVERVFDPAIDDAGRLLGFSFESIAGGMRHVGKATPDEREECRVMAWNISSPEVSGSIRVSLEEETAGTGVEVEIRVESAGFLSAVFFPVIASAIGNGMPEAIERFAAGLSGEG